MPDMFYSVYGMALNSLSYCFAVEVGFLLSIFLLRVIDIVAEFIHYRLSILPVSRTSMFYLLLLICSHALMIKKFSILLYKLHISNTLNLF